MKIKKKELTRLAEGLQAVKNLKGVKFAYAVVKNIGVIDPELEAINKASIGSEDFIKYESERIKLCKKHAIKDDDGSCKISMTAKGPKYEIEDSEKFKVELDKLNKEAEKVLKDRKKQMEEVDALLEEDACIEIHRVKFDELPEDITAGQLESIIEMVD